MLLVKLSLLPWETEKIEGGAAENRGLSSCSAVREHMLEYWLKLVLWESLKLSVIILCPQPFSKFNCKKFD